MTPAPSQNDTWNTATAAHFVHAAVKLLRVIRRWRRVFLGILLAVCGLGLVYCVAAPRVYQAKASLLITPSGAEAFTNQPTAEYQNQALIPTFERLVGSSVVLEGALELLARQDPDRRIDFAGQPPAQWGDVLRSGLYTSGPRRTRMVDVSYRSKSPEAAESVLSAVVDSYLAFIDENHRNISLEVKKILDEEREQVERSLLQKEDQLVRLKQELRDPGTDQQEDLLHPVIARATQLNDTLVEATLRRLELEALVAAAREAVERGGNVGSHLLGLQPEVGRAMVLSTFGVYGKDSYLIARMRADLIEEQAHLRSLRGYLGDAHPQVTAVAAKVRNLQQHLDEYDNVRIGSLAQLHNDQLGAALVSVAQQELSRAWQHERKLQAEYAQAETEAIDLSGRVAQITLLDHDRELLGELHEVLLNRAADLRITQEHSDVRVSVVTEPTASREAVSPSFAFIGIVCLVLGVGGGGFVVYVLDVLDDRFRSADEAADQLQTNLLAVLPPMPLREAVGCRAVQVHAAPDARESEAFRTLRTALKLSAEEVGRLVVSSAEPGDGKTTVLANLATSYAQAGKRTLIIDGDLRRPGLTRLFELRGQEGLSNVLRSDANSADSFARRVQPSGIPGLDILPSGARPQHPSELLSSQQFPALLAWAETVYDQILIDSPPILAASDSTVIGRLADGLVLVVQPQKNHRRMVLRAVEAIRSVGVNLVGVAVNRLPGDTGSGYDKQDARYLETYGREDDGDSSQEDGAERVAVRFDPREREMGRQDIGSKTVAPGGRNVLRRAA